MPGPRDPMLTGYMVPFGRQVHEGQYRRVVAVTAAQAGKTDTILDVIGARLEQRPAPILYVGPSRDFVRDQFEPRLMQLIDEAPSLAAKMLRGKRNKKLLKIVAGVRVRLGFAGSSSSLKSDPFALGIVDEYDEMSANIRGQGDPLGLAEARGDTYADFVTAVVSTCSRGIAETEIDPVNGLELWKPGDPEQIESPIWRLWQAGTRHHFAWPCPHCGEFFVPRFKHLRWPRGASPAEARRGAYVLCPSPDCGGVIEDHHKPEMIAGGVMVAPGQTIEDAKAGVNAPDNSTWSQWTSGLCSPFVSFGKRAETYLSAFSSGEEDKIQTAMNAGFGELYSPGAAGELPEWAQLLRHRLPFERREVPRGVLRVVAGVDVQKRSLIYVIRGFGARGTSWLLDYGQLHGMTDQPEVWNDLTLLMTQPVGGLVIEKVFIDSGFRPDKVDAGDEHKVYEWARKNSFIATPTKGRDTIAGKPYSVKKIEVKPDGKAVAYSLDLVHINTDFFKGLVHSRLKTELDEPGAFFLHNGDADSFEDYCRQLVSEVRVLENGVKPRWVKRQRDNHYLDCEALAAAAGYVLNVQAIPEGVERDEGWTPPADDEAAGVDPEPPRDEPAVSPSIRDRFRNMGARARR